jgi:DNA uptake protein ComE-like DNA-binding protein
MRSLHTLTAFAVVWLIAGPAPAQDLKPDPYRDRTTPPAATPRPAPPTAPAARQDGTPRPAPQANLVDINSATKDELQMLKGVNAARADEIIKRRPYKSKAELASRKIVPQTVYDEIKDRITAGPATGAARRRPQQ